MALEAARALVQAAQHLVRVAVSASFLFSRVGWVETQHRHGLGALGRDPAYRGSPFLVIAKRVRRRFDLLVGTQLN